MDAYKLVSDRGFRGFIKVECGSEVVTLMTHETHPELMRLYYELCDKAGIPKRPIYIVKGGKISAAADRLREVIIIDESFLNGKTQRQLCAVFGHEEDHFDRRQFVNGMFIAISAGVPAFVLSRQLKEWVGELTDNKDAQQWMQVLHVLITLTAIGGGIIAGKRHEQFASDAAGARLAGADAMIDAISKPEEPVSRRSFLTQLRGAVDVEPPIHRRIEKLKRRFAKEPEQRQTEASTEPGRGQ